MTHLPSAVTNNNTSQVQLVAYTLTEMRLNSKFILDLFAISFLRGGIKEISFQDKTTVINNTKALLIAEGNCLVSEKGHLSHDYNSTILFFSSEKLREILLKKGWVNTKAADEEYCPFFVIEQDDFVKSFMLSLNPFLKPDSELGETILEIKLEEILTYLHLKYKQPFVSYLANALSGEKYFSFKKIIEVNKFSNLKLDQLAFLCNMSISTFKRKFAEVYKTTPALWFKEQQLNKAKALLESGHKTASEIFETTGYKSLSNFSTAYKKKFGQNAKRVK